MPIFLPFLLTLVILETLEANVIRPDFTYHGYITNIGIPLAEKIRKAEEKKERIVGGVPAALGQYPFQAGLIGDIKNTTNKSICGGSLITSSRVLTAAHCWDDGETDVWQFTVVLGSTLIFSGGQRIQTSKVVTHPKWFPILVRNDVAVVYLPNPVELSGVIGTVSLPAVPQQTETFVGESAIAIGYGITKDDETVTLLQSQNQVRLNVINNAICSLAYPFMIQSSHLCTNGLGGYNICRGDSGGPLVTSIDDELVQIGISSFVSVFGCESNLPGVFTRVTSYMDFITSQI